MATFTARTISDDDLPAWHALWDESPRFLAQHPGYFSFAPTRAASAFGVWSGDRLVLAIAFHLLPLRGATMWSAPLFASFGGPLVSAATLALTGLAAERFWRDALEALDAELPASADIVEMLFPPGCHDARPLVWKGWEARPHYNYVSAWKEAGAWRHAMESSARRQERKALAAGLTPIVRNASETDGLARLWRLNAQRNKLDEELAAPLAELGAWLAREERGFLVEIANSKGEPETAALVGFDEHRVYYLAGASDPECLGSGAPTLLQTSILAEIDRRDLPKYYDWVGANTPGVARFKRHFGPELETLIAVRRTGRKARLIETGRRLLRP
ncbi:MAG: hypothetical protein PWP23_780 [Candidatus Sumerlaeota bacterium]|nr:hypothetical protein [Candidatus Sumerlaeota bacterium]